MSDVLPAPFHPEPRRRQRRRLLGGTLAPVLLPVLVLMVLMLMLAAGMGCDPSTSLTRLGLFGFQRNSLVTTCCNCLDQTIGVDRAAQVCPEVDLDLDGGPVPDAGKWATPCLCGASAGTCRDLLNNDEAVIVVGKCVGEFGPCASACSGVLAYPGTDDES